MGINVEVKMGRWVENDFTKLLDLHISSTTPTLAVNAGLFSSEDKTEGISED